MLVTSTITWRAGTFPRPLGLLCFAIALVMLLSLSFLQWIVLLFPAWVAVASVYLLAAEARSARAADDDRRRTPAD